MAKNGLETPGKVLELKENLSNFTFDQSESKFKTG